jgi:replicative DNA helicase
MNIPHSLEAEQAILGAILTDQDGLFLDETFTSLPVEWFYDPANSKVYEIMKEMHAENLPIDVVTLPDKIKSMNLLTQTGGVDYVVSLAVSSSGSGNVSYYISILKDKFQRRLVKQQAYKLQNWGENESLDSLIPKYEEWQREVLQISSSDKIKQLRDYILEEISAKPPEKLFKTGLTQFDMDVSFERQKLMIVAGVPGVGKTSFILNLMVDAVKAGQRVLFNCLEMRKWDLFNRLAAIYNNVTMNEVIEDRSKYWGELLKLDNFYLEHYKLYTPDSIAKKCYELKPDVVFVDHHKRLESGINMEKSPVYHYELISSKLLKIAEKQNICMVLVCHLTKDQFSKEPTGSEIHGSGAFRQDADTILMLYNDDIANKSRVIIKVAKNRSSLGGKIPVKFIQEKARFVNEGGW